MNEKSPSQATDVAEKEKKILYPTADYLPVKERARRLQEKTAVLGIRRIQPFDDLMGAEPNDPSPHPPETIEMDPGDLWVDASYQRNLSRKSVALIIRIIANWDWSRFKPPVVARDPQGRLNIIDGQHTAIAALTHPVIKKIPVLVVDIETVKEAAGAFLAHNTERVFVTSFDKWQAKITAEDPTVCQIDEILTANNITVARNLKKEENNTIAVGELEKRFKMLGPIKFREYIEHVAACNFAPIKQEHLIAMSILLYPTVPTPGPEIVPSLLVDVIHSLSDPESLGNAARLAQSMAIGKGEALALHWKTKYKVHYYRGNK